MVNTSMTNTAKQPDEPRGGKSTPQTSRPRGGAPSGRFSRGPKAYFNEVLREMKKVSWPTRHETNRLTGVVLAVCLMIGGLLSGLGYLFDIVISIVTKGHI